LINHTGDALAVYRQADLHGEIPIALNEVLRSVHGIDHPDALFFQTSLGIGRFLSQDAVIGKLGCQATHDQIICFAVSGRDLFDFLERVYLLLNQKRAVVVREQDRACLAREFGGHRYFVIKLFAISRHLQLRFRVPHSVQRQINVGARPASSFSR
jgi:hypothetical protein